MYYRCIVCAVFVVLTIKALFGQGALTWQQYDAEYLKFLSSNKPSIDASDVNNGVIPPPFRFDTGIPSSFSGLRELPPIYDLRTTNSVTPVRDQGSCGSCWAFATYGAIESRYLADGSNYHDFSENNLIYGHGFESAPCNGGNSRISSAYLARGRGPVEEHLDPYQGENGSYHPGLARFSYIYDAFFLPDDIEVIKQTIYDYGAVYSSFFWGSENYNSTDYTYYYSGDTTTNHAICLIGWDDELITSGGQGAWIVRNNWGADWGDGGYFYVSYFDSHISAHTAIWLNEKQQSPAFRIHSYDDLGAISAFWWQDATNYGLVKYTIPESQFISHVGIWTYSANTVIDIQLFNSFNGVSCSGLLGQALNVECEYPGYRLIELVNPIGCNDDDEIYIKVGYYTPDGYGRIPIEIYSEGYANPDIQTDKCWISDDGIDWISIGADEDINADLCVKLVGEVKEEWIYYSFWSDITSNMTRRIKPDGSQIEAVLLGTTNMDVSYDSEYVFLRSINAPPQYNNELLRLSINTGEIDTAYWGNIDISRPHWVKSTYDKDIIYSYAQTSAYELNLVKYNFENNSCSIIATGLMSDTFPISSPDNTAFAFLSSNGTNYNIAVLNPSTDSIVYYNANANGEWYGSLAWSAEGYIYYGRSRPNEDPEFSDLYRMNIETNEHELIYSESMISGWPHILECDRSVLVFVGYNLNSETEEIQCSIFMYNELSNSISEVVSLGNVFVQTVTSSPRAAKVALTVDAPDSRNIYILDLETYQIEFLAEGSNPQWIGNTSTPVIVSIVDDKYKSSQTSIGSYLKGFPNPFNPIATINYHLPTSSDATLAVFDIMGRPITTLVETHQSAGTYNVIWSGTDNSGNLVSTGMYFCRLQAGDYSKTIKLVYLK
jgi:C1A family cysteine protease